MFSDIVGNYSSDAAAALRSRLELLPPYGLQ